MAKLDLSVIVKTVGQQKLNRLNGDLAKVDTQAGKTQGKLGGLGASLSSLISPQTALIAGGAAIVGVFAGAAKAAIDEQKGVALLTQAIKANDSASVNNIESIEATITERQKLAFADDEQRESLGSLISVTKDSNKALELQRVAMDLASASTLIGKVYAGNLGILSRYGIQLEKGATATEAIAEIQRRAAGQAEAYAETTAGSIEAAKLAVDDLSEDFGAEILLALESIQIGAVKVATSFDQLAQQTVKDFAAVGDVLTTDFLSLEGIGDAVDTLTGHVDEKLSGMPSNAQIQALAAVRAIEAEYVKGGPVIAAEAGKIAGLLPSEIAARDAEIRAAGAHSVVEFAAGIIEKQQDPGLAWDAAVEASETALSRSEQIALIHGRLSSSEFIAGVNSDTPGVSAAFQAYAVVAQEQLGNLGADAHTWGSGIGYSMANGIYETVPVVKDAAGNLANAVFGQIGIRSEPKDPSSPLRGITEWGGNIAKTVADGLYRNLDLVDSASGALASRLSVTPSGGQGGGSNDGGAPAPVTINLTVSGDLRASESTLPTILQRAVFASDLREPV